jgi:hypothetical protein
MDDRLFATAAEAREAGRLEGCEKWKLYTVRGDGGRTWAMWSNGAGNALARAAAAAGFVATRADEPVSKDQLAAGLAALSDEERAVLIAQYVPAAKPAKPGKGKGQPAADAPQQ